MKKQKNSGFLSSGSMADINRVLRTYCDTLNHEQYYILYAHPEAWYRLKVECARHQYKRDQRARRIKARRKLEREVKANVEFKLEHNRMGSNWNRGLFHWSNYITLL